MPPLPADFIHARACKLKCEKILTRPSIREPNAWLHIEDVVQGVWGATPTSRNCGFRQRREPQFRVFVGTKTLLAPCIRNS